MKLLLPRGNPALTRLEVLAVLAALALLAAVALPVLAGGKPRSDIAVCASNLRQLGMAALMYSMEEDGVFPERSSTNRWPQRLLRYYGSLDVLRCPTDVANPLTFGGPTALPADRAPRSYIINGWSDYLVQVFPSPWDFYARYFGMPEAAIPYPAQTILFGEKESFSGHTYVDLANGVGNDLTVVEYARHGSRRAGAAGGGSNHAMVDGSVRLLRFGQGMAPTNLWAVTDIWRTNSIAQ